MANTSYTQKAMTSLGANNEKTMKNELNYKNFSELAWSVINLYFKEDYLKQLVRHQIESYNYFMNYQIQETINMFNPIVIEYEEKLEPWCKIKTYITFNNFKLYQPQIFENNGSSKIMFPNEARLRNFTYASNMTLDLDIKYEIIDEKKGTNETIMNTLNGISIGKINYLKSDICILKQYSHVFGG